MAKKKKKTAKKRPKKKSRAPKGAGRGRGRLSPRAPKGAGRGRGRLSARPNAGASKPASRAKRGASLPKDRFDPQLHLKKRARRAVVLGLGRSGFHAARLLARKGFKVLVSDTRPRREIRDLAARLPEGVRWEGGGHSERILESHFAVKSPGIPSHAPVLAMLREADIPVFSELETALAFLPPVELVAVTGTNGKTTTAAMTEAVFKAARRRVHLFGNVGSALSMAAGKVRKSDVLVLEVSSYQLEDSRSFRPDAAVILNVTRDHLEHHGSMDAYMAAKARIYRQQNRACTAVFNAGDPLSLHLARRCRARKLFFGQDPSTRTAAWIEKGRIKVRLPGERKPKSIVPPKLPGAHNLENAMAAALLGLARGAAHKAVERAFKSFRGVEHRIETVGTFKGIECINDSKATNVDSALACLRSVGPDREKRILLILGGLTKGGGFRALRPHVERSVKAVLAIGSAAPKVEEDLQGSAHVFPCETLETAVRVAYQIGQKGDCLLLSPACASFDQFKDFEERGRAFKELAAKLGRGK